MKSRFSIMAAIQVVAEPQKSALDKLAEKVGAPAPASVANPLLQAAMNAAIPECAGCGNVKLPDGSLPTTTDAEGRAFHKACLDVLKKK